MNTPDQYAALAEVNPEAITFDGLEDAYLGYVEQKCGPALACYDWNKCVQALMDGGMTSIEAIEWMDFNVTGAYVGENTPCFLYRPDE